MSECVNLTTNNKGFCCCLQFLLMGDSCLKTFQTTITFCVEGERGEPQNLKQKKQQQNGACVLLFRFVVNCLMPISLLAKLLLFAKIH